MKNLLNRIIRYQIPESRYLIIRKNKTSRIRYQASGILYLTTVVLLLLTFWGCEELLIGPEPENTPKSNFEILWKTLDENYALFPVKSVNWDSLHIVYGSKITSNTTESELWDICGELISTLNDGHVSLLNKGITKFYPSSEISRREPNDFSLDLIKDKFLVDIKTAGDGYFTYGKIKNTNIGYVHLLTFAGSSRGNGYEWSYDINKIVNEFSDCDAMILDLRNNGGGLKITGWIIAAAIVDRDITYFYQQMKTGPGHNDFSKPIPLTASPREDVSRFTKKIALLTNKFSASGSEHFSQLCKNLSYVTQIGDTTFGAFGDIIGTGTLPNGWTFFYPCRLTKTPDGFCPEGIGIIPDVLVENTKADINGGRDKVMNYAINYLSQ